MNITEKDRKELAIRDYIYSNFLEEEFRSKDCQIACGAFRAGWDAGKMEARSFHGDYSFLDEPRIVMLLRDLVGRKVTPDQAAFGVKKLSEII